MGFPIVVSLLQMLIFFVCYFHNTPTNNLNYGRKSQAFEALKLVYKREGPFSDFNSRTTNPVSSRDPSLPPPTLFLKTPLEHLWSV